MRHQLFQMAMFAMSLVFRQAAGVDRQYCKEFDNRSIECEKAGCKMAPFTKVGVIKSKYQPKIPAIAHSLMTLCQTQIAFVPWVPPY